MNWRRITMAALCAGGLCFSLARSEEADKSVGAADDLTWLAGHWKGPTDNGGEWEASYSSPTGGEIVSANKELRGGRVVMVEFEHFRRVDGKLVLVPFPYGKQSSASFPLSALDREARKATFTNMEHDFPQEIVYHRAADDRLLIHVSGVQRGQPLKLTLDLARQR